MVPAIIIAGKPDDVYFNGDVTAEGLGQAGVASCTATVGEHYVALNSDQWNSSFSCNQCIEVVCEDKKCIQQNPITLLVTAECPGCEDEGLDLSSTVFKKFTDEELNLISLKWEFAECPEKLGVYEAGIVEPAIEDKTKVSILQTGVEGVEVNNENAETQSSSGTNPVVVSLIVLAAVGVFVLVALFYRAKKMSSRREDCVTKSFNTFSSPAQKKKKAAIVTI